MKCSCKRPARKKRLRLAVLILAAGLLPLHVASLQGRGRGPGRRPTGITLTEVRSFDGAGYTPGDVGAAHTPLLRIAPADYPGNGSGDRIVTPPHRENPRTISNLLVAQSGDLPNDRGLTDYLWLFGQFVDHDIDLTDMGGETAHVPVLDENDPLAPGPIPFHRSVFDSETGTPHVPRQQTNAITAFIDASNVYGSDPGRAAALRAFSGGRLLTSEGDLLPFNDPGLPNAGGPSPALFLAGDVRANENVALTAMHTLFVREHNRLARRVARHAPDADDETIYQITRKIVAAELQIITYEEFLPALLGPYAPRLADYDGYDPTVDPSIANEFSTAFYRFGHSLLSPSLVLAERRGEVGTLPLRNTFFNPGFLADDPDNLDRLLRGLARQRCQEVDPFLIDDVRNFLFGPPGAGGLDLATLNIQRGRDHGLPDYHTLRVAYGLPSLQGVEDVTSDPFLQTGLVAVYGSVDNVDPWLGGLAEDHVPATSVGPTLLVAIGEQFTRLRDGDPFFFLDDPDLDQRLVRKVIDLDDVTLARIIRWNTGVRDLPDDVFRLPRRTRPPRARNGRPRGQVRRRNR